tara:strand:+ start:13755 stop:14828 length:1074 start_codon:yes stop_codon:yes gene_type:complete
MRILWLLFFLSISNAQILVESGITHGGEIEFTSDQIYAADSKSKVGGLRGSEFPAAVKMAEAVAKKCRALGCKVTQVNGKWGKEFFVQLHDGWWFQISYDPLCVEIQTKPSTIQELYTHQDLKEELIFGSAREAGLESRPSRATHMNTGARSAFGYDLRSLFNYFVDNANHPELSSGVFRSNWNTSPPLALSRIDLMTRIKDIQILIETGSIKSFSQLANVIVDRLHSYFLNPQFNPKRNQDLTFRKLVSLTGTQEKPQFAEIDVPFERRAVRAVRSFSEFILHAEMIESRIAWIKVQPGFIPFKKKVPELLGSYQRDVFFESWLKESGLSVDRYLPLIKASPARKPLNSCQKFYSN